LNEHRGIAAAIRSMTATFVGKIGDWPSRLRRVKALSEDSFRRCRQALDIGHRSMPFSNDVKDVLTT